MHFRATYLRIQNSKTNGEWNKKCITSKMDQIPFTVVTVHCFFYSVCVLWVVNELNKCSTHSSKFQMFFYVVYIVRSYSTLFVLFKEFVYIKCAILLTLTGENVASLWRSYKWNSVNGCECDKTLKKSEMIRVKKRRSAKLQRRDSFTEKWCCF